MAGLFIRRVIRGRRGRERGGGTYKGAAGGVGVIETEEVRVVTATATAVERDGASIIEVPER